MAVRKVNSTLEVLTRELAQQFTNMPHLPGERDCKPGRILFFQKHLAEGTFIDPTWSKGICKEDGKEYRLDGQHSSFALATLDMAQPFPELMVTIQSYEFDSLSDDAPTLFDIFDNPASVRTDVDIIGIFKAPFDDLKELPKAYLDRAAKGVLFYNRELVDKSKAVIFRKRQKGLYFKETVNREFAVWLYQFIGSKHDWLIGKDGVVAEIYSDFQYNPTLAFEFWSYVFNESHPDPDHVTRDLSSTLKEWSRAAKKKTAIQFHKLTKKTWDTYRKMAELQAA